MRQNNHAARGMCFSEFLYDTLQNIEKYHNYCIISTDKKVRLKNPSLFYFIHFKFISLNTLPILYNMHQTKEMLQIIENHITGINFDQN